MKAATSLISLNASVSSISIHAAREGGDAFMFKHGFVPSLFQSTPPVKAATCKILAGSADDHISIHAAREGGDVIPSKPVVQISNFNPRRP